jgi:2-aminoadipate transaminase
VATVYSERVARLFPSPVREILKAASGGKVASLAGGLPAEETFPVLSGLPTGWGQYGLTEGDAEFRRAVSEHLEERGLSCPPDRILATSGSQQGLDLAAKLFVDVGTPVACESPTYVAALQVLRLFGADLRGLSLSGKDGPEPRSVEPFLSSADFRLAYAIPTYHNPTGAVWSDDAREAFARACDLRGIPVLEDDPYGEIGFGARPPRPVCARLGRAPWMFLGSFSKSFMPGLRLGFLAASAELFTPLERLKQAADLHSCRLSQALVLADLRDKSRPARLDALRARYRLRRDAFEASLRRHFPGVRFDAPDGGLFFWVHLAPGLDLRSIAPSALARGVAFLPGEHCFSETDPPKGWARLNFSNAAPEVADRALGVLAEVVAEAA